MNIYGYKLRIQKAKKQLAKGISHLGERKFNNLERNIICWRHCIQKLRENKKKKIRIKA